MGQVQSKSAGYGALVVLSMQVGLQPLLQKQFAPPEVSRVSLVLACELVKMLTSAGLLTATGGWSEAAKSWTPASMLAAAGTPAVIYAVQNICIQTAYSKLSMLVFNLLNQSKIIFTAVFLYLLAGKHQTRRQVVALLMLTAAAATLTLKPDADGASEKEKKSSYVGIGCVLAASGLSGLATSLSQITLQTNGRSSYLFSLELAVVSTLTLLGGAAASGNTAKFSLQGWTPQTLVPVMTQGFGGILIGQVTKNLGAVEKCFATVLGILITGVAQQLVDGAPQHANTANFMINRRAQDRAKADVIEAQEELKAARAAKARAERRIGRLLAELNAARALASAGAPAKKRAMGPRHQFAAVMVMVSILLHASSAATA